MKTNKISLDSTITQEEMYAYGYTWPGMIPLREKKAIELFPKYTIYKLHEDGSEAEVENMNDLLNFAQEDGLFGVEVEQYQQEHTLNTMEGCNSLYQWLQGKEEDDFLFKNQPNLTADEAFAVIYYLQERFHVIPDTIEKCSCCNELYDSEDADVQEKIGDERERACCRNCCCEEEEIRNIEVFYRRDDKVLISKKELIQLIEDDKTDEIISRFKPGYIPGCILEELAEKLQLPYFQECGADDIDID